MKFETGSKESVIRDMARYAIQDRESLIESLSSVKDCDYEKTIEYCKKCIRDYEMFLGYTHE